MAYVYHIALKKDWETAQKSGTYTMSTLGKTLGEIGFIHLSYHDQVLNIATLLYSGVTEPLVILMLDTKKMQPGLLKSELSNGEYFPHYYGSINPTWVVKVIPLREFK